MAISECPSRETYLAADISLIVENRGVTTAELGFRGIRGLRGRNNGEPQLSVSDIQPVVPGCICSKLGFWFWVDARPGQTEGGRMETMLRRFAAGLWGTSWIGLQVCLAWFPFRGAWFEGISAGTPAQRILLHYC